MGNKELEKVFNEDNEDKKAIIALHDEIKATKEKNNGLVNKRIDFDKKTLKRLEIMLPIYKDEISSNNSSKLYSYVVKKAIDSLFEGDFKDKITRL